MPPTKKNLKATKKFEKNHLKGVLERRKATAKIKQRAVLKDKKRTKRAQDAEFTHGAAATDDKSGGAAPVNGLKKGAKSGAMSVDDFFQGGFEILEKNGRPKKGPAKLGKRKRNEPDDIEGGAPEEDAENSSEASFDEQPVISDVEDGSDSEDDDAGGMSQKTMDNLARKDPEFYQFLKENDPDALDFDENADLAEVDELSAAGSDDDEAQPKKKRKKSKATDKKEESAINAELTLAMVTRWKKSMDETQSLRAARQVVLAFRSAANLNQEDDVPDDSRRHYKISSPEVFHELLVVSLTQIPMVIEHHLPVKTSAGGKVHVATETKKFKGLSVLIKTYVASVINLLATLSDEGTLKLTMSSITPIIPHLMGFRKLLKALTKSIVGFWSQSSSSEATRITAFLVLRKVVEVGDRGVRESVLKATYQALVQGCRRTNPNTIQGINLMKNSAAELWGIDEGIGYTTAFVSIRQLALHLRNSIVHNKKDAYKAVYNWQYTHSLDFWSCMLAEHCSSTREAETGKESKLKLLIYPLVQVTLGAMGLVPSPTYFPFRFHLIRSLLRISRATGTYIPIGASLLEVLNSAEMKKPPKSASLKTLDFSVNYKAPAAYLHTRVYQDGVGEQVVELFGEYFTLWCKSIAFPEFALPVLIQLKRWLKQARGKGPGAGAGNKNGKLWSLVKVLTEKLEANSRFVEERRAKVDFAPKDRAQVEAFLRELEWEKTPLGAYVVGQRKQRAERARMMVDARKEDERKRKEEERQGVLGEEDDSSGEVEEDDEELMDDGGFGGFGDEEMEDDEDDE